MQHSRTLRISIRANFFLTRPGFEKYNVVSRAASSEQFRPDDVDQRAVWPCHSVPLSISISLAFSTGLSSGLLHRYLLIYVVMFGLSRTVLCAIKGLWTQTLRPSYPGLQRTCQPSVRYTLRCRLLGVPSLWCKESPPGPVRHLESAVLESPVQALDAVCCDSAGRSGRHWRTVPVTSARFFSRTALAGWSLGH